jgi:hypothetical protein
MKKPERALRGAFVFAACMAGGKLAIAPDSLRRMRQQMVACRLNRYALQVAGPLQIRGAMSHVSVQRGLFFAPHRRIKCCFNDGLQGVPDVSRDAGPEGRGDFAFRAQLC